MPGRQASQNRSAEELATWLQKLARVGLHYHDEPDTEACIICIRCGYAIKADGDRVTQHLHKHNVHKDDQSSLADFIRSLQLPNPKDLPSRPDGSAPHPHLSLQTVFNCRHCEMRSASIEL
jgi:DNA-directed RNA polymerase subunit M/transcription elongation factor TFIIS